MRCFVFFLMILFLNNHSVICKTIRQDYNFKNKSGIEDITSFTHYVSDNKLEHTIHSASQIADSLWKPLPNPPWFSNSGGVYWLKVKVNNLAKEKFFLNIPFPFISYIDVYISRNNGKWEHFYGGRAYSNETCSLPIHSYNYYLGEPGAEVEIYLLMQNNWVTIPIIEISTADVLLKYETKYMIWQGIYIGIIAALFIYNFFIWIVLRRKVYLFYLYHLLCVLLVCLQHSGFSCLYFWSCEKVQLWECFVRVSMITAPVLFTQNFLDLKKTLPKINILLNCIVVVTYAYLIGFPFTMDIGNSVTWPSELINIITIIIPPVLIICGIYSLYFKKYEPARFYIFGWSVYLLLALILISINNGLIRFEIVKFLSIEYGSAAEALLFSFALADSVRVMNKEKRALERRQIILEIEKCETELTALKAQLNPHFVFNSLSSLQSLIYSHKHNEAIRFLNDFSSLTRKTLENATKSSIILSEEIDFLKKYINMELMHNESSTDVIFEIDEKLDPDLEAIPPMVIQPYVENAIKHGLSRKEGKGKLHIRFTNWNDSELVCIIEDNGIGRSRAAMYKDKNHVSMALDITKGLLDTLNKLKKQGERFKVSIEDLSDSSHNPAGTRVTLIFSTDNELNIVNEYDKGNYS